MYLSAAMNKICLIYEFLFKMYIILLLFHNYSRQETNILSPESLSMSNSVETYLYIQYNIQ
jgi:hypothetical protein